MRFTETYRDEYWVATPLNPAALDSSKCVHHLPPRTTHTASSLVVCGLIILIPIIIIILIVLVLMGSYSLYG
jgi:hypothetical protein